MLIPQNLARKLTCYFSKLTATFLISQLASDKLCQEENKQYAKTSEIL